MTQKTVIIGGCGSSGTTLLAHLLSANSALLVGPELNFFNHRFLLSESRLKYWSDTSIQWKPEPFAYFYPDRLLTGLEYYKVDSATIKKIAQGIQSVKDFYDEVECLFLSKAHKEIWFEKTPSNCYTFKDFRDLDGRKMVLVVRDPRDVVTSLRKRGFPLLFCACRWLFDTLIGLKGQSGDTLCLVKYEDMTRYPHEVVHNILRFAGVPQTLIDLHGKSEPSFNEDWSQSLERKNWNLTPKDPVSGLNTGTWKSALDSEELSMIMSVRLSNRACEVFGLPSCSISELMHALGYAHSVDQASSWLNFRRTRAIHELHEEHTNREEKANMDGLGHWNMRYPAFKAISLNSQNDPPHERLASVIDASSSSLIDISV